MKNRIDPNELFKKIHETKVKHASLAERYRRGETDSVITRLYSDTWGRIITYMYETSNFNYGEASQKLLLTHVIAEHALLYKYRGLLKNITISIIGLGGAGKTTYAILSAIGALQLLGYSDKNEIKTLVTDSTFFDSYTMVNRIYEIVRNGEWKPFIIIDDVGTQITKYWVFLGQHYWSYFFSVMDHIKDWTGCLILTARKFESIASRLREISDIVIEATTVTTVGGIVASIFEWYRADEYRGKMSRRSKLKRMKFIDLMPPTAMMPQDIWDYMMEKRREVGEKRLGFVVKAIEILPRIEEIQLNRMLQRVKSITNKGGEE